MFLHSCWWQKGVFDLACLSYWYFRCKCFLVSKILRFFFSFATSYSNTYFSVFNYHWLTEKYSPKCYTVQIEYRNCSWLFLRSENCPLMKIMDTVACGALKFDITLFQEHHDHLQSYSGALISTLWLKQFMTGPRVGGALHEAAVPLRLRRGASAGLALQVAPRKAGKHG